MLPTTDHGLKEVLMVSPMSVIGIIDDENSIPLAIAGDFSLKFHFCLLIISSHVYA